MPAYDYKCNECKKYFTVTEKISEYEENPLPKCKHCGSTNVKRIYSSVTVVTSKKS